MNNYDDGSNDDYVAVDDDGDYYNEHKDNYDDEPNDAYVIAIDDDNDYHYNKDGDNYDDESNDDYLAVADDDGYWNDDCHDCYYDESNDDYVVTFDDDDDYQFNEDRDKYDESNDDDIDAVDDNSGSIDNDKCLLRHILGNHHNNVNDDTNINSMYNLDAGKFGCVHEPYQTDSEIGYQEKDTDEACFLQPRSGNENM